MKNIKALLAYSGSRYFGFQKTKMGPSIEEELERALEKILGHPIVIQAASRTDRGVHAEGQVVNFFVKKKLHFHNCIVGLGQSFPMIFLL